MGEFKTSDMALCAFLKTEDIGWVRIDVVEKPRWDEERQRKVSGRAEMVFADNEDLHEAVMEYRTGNARVEPQEFQKAVGYVRSHLLDAIQRDTDS